MALSFDSSPRACLGLGALVDRVGELGEEGEENTNIDYSFSWIDDFIDREEDTVNKCYTTLSGPEALYPYLY
jgi:hypothetical protein